MEHFITEVRIGKVRHLRNISIKLDAGKRQHLILTGKNGSGKTSVLEALKNSLLAISKKKGYWDKNGRMTYKEFAPAVLDATRWDGGEPVTEIETTYNRGEDIYLSYYPQGHFITAFFPAVRPINDITEPQGVEEVILKPVFTVDDDPAKDIARYMVHLKTQQIFAKDANDAQTEQNIEAWFNRFENSLKILMDDASVRLKYEYKKYSFEIQQDGREQANFNHLSDGYASVFRIFADLIMRMDQNWLSGNQLSEYNKEGVVLIDEIETHLHLELQKTILPSLIKLFPRVQFIISTHSPFVLSSIENVVIYDLENNTLVNQPQGLTDVPYDGIVEGYFHADKLSALLRGKYERFKELVAKKGVTDEDMREISQLEVFLDEIPDYLALDIATEYKRMKSEFEAREDL